MPKVGSKKDENLPVPMHEQLPAWMQNETVTGMEDLGQYIQPPRMKVVQKQSGPPFDELFMNGEVIVVPQMLKVAGMIGTKVGEPFYFAPLFFFAEWCLINPIELKGSQPFVAERSTDSASPMAAKSRNPALWLTNHPTAKDEKGNPLQMRYVEMLNYVVALHGDHELAGVPVVMSFSKAEHRAGSNFAALLKIRRAPIYGCQFMGVTGYRSNSKGQWFGIDVMNPAADSGVAPFVQDQPLFEKHKELHLELKQAHEEAKIRVDYDDAPDAASGEVDTDKTEY